MDEQCGDYHLLWTIFTHTLSLSLCKEGRHWSINGTEIIRMGLELFVFFKLFRFVFARSHWFSKKARRETKN